MPTDINLSILEPVRAGLAFLGGFRLLFGSLAGRLETQAPRQDPQSDAPEEGVALLATELRCLVEDAITPAILRLETLIEEWSPQLSAPESEE